MIARLSHLTVQARLLRQQCCHLGLQRCWLHAPRHSVPWAPGAPLWCRGAKDGWVHAACDLVDLGARAIVCEQLAVRWTWPEAAVRPLEACDVLAQTPYGSAQGKRLVQNECGEHAPAARL